MQPLYDDISASCVCGKRTGSGQVKSAVRPEARIRNSHLPFVPWQESGEIRLVPLDNVARFHSRGYRTPYPLYREGLSSPVQRRWSGHFWSPQRKPGRTAALWRSWGESASLGSVPGWVQWRIPVPAFSISCMLVAAQSVTTYVIPIRFAPGRLGACVFTVGAECHGWR